VTISKPTGTPAARVLFSRRVARVVPALCAALVLSACGGGGSSTPAQSDSAATPAPDTSAGNATPPAFPTASPFPKGDKALPGMPAITANATAFDKEPTIAKGTGPAPGNLFIRDLIVGTGKTAVATDSVDVRYVGALYSDGTVFDASWKNGSAPVNFPLSSVVPGFAGGIVGMKEGGRREIVIPSFLGYGEVDQPTIPAGSTLVFVVDLVSIK
jgi:peptidylprolyl isomerase